MIICAMFIVFGHDIIPHHHHDHDTSEVFHSHDHFPAHDHSSENKDLSFHHFFSLFSHQLSSNKLGFLFDIPLSDNIDIPDGVFNLPVGLFICAEDIPPDIFYGDPDEFIKEPSIEFLFGLKAPPVFA